LRIWPKLDLPSASRCKKAVGIDISKEMINGFSVLFEYFSELDIEPILGDFLLTEWEDKSYDVVILNEAISRVRDTELLLDKIQSILRPQGKLFIKDGNNEVFFASRLARRRLWKKGRVRPQRPYVSTVIEDVRTQGLLAAVDHMTYRVACIQMGALGT
jgi:SAM-dependent methyltransferase